MIHDKEGLGESSLYDPLQAFYGRHHLVPIVASDKVDGRDIAVIVEADARRALELVDERIWELTRELAHQVGETARLINVAAGIDVKQWREEHDRLILARNEIYESRQEERATVRRQAARIAELEAQQEAARDRYAAEIAAARRGDS